MALTSVIPLTVNTKRKRFVDNDDTGVAPHYRDVLRLIQGEIMVLGLEFLDGALAAEAFGVADTFQLRADLDYDHTTLSGTLDAGESGAQTAIVATFTDSAIATAHTSGAIILRQNTPEGSRERVVFTNLVVAGTGPYTATFTVNKTLTNAYSAGDYCDIEDPFMVESTDDDFNVAGDWASLDVVGGKLSVRVDCSRWTFQTKFLAAVAAGADEVAIKLEIDRFVSGSTLPQKLLQDVVYARGAVGDVESTSIPSQDANPNWTAADARYLRGVAGCVTEYAAVFVSDVAGVLVESAAIKTNAGGDLIVETAAPRVVLMDSDCTDADDNATIEATATDTGTGTEDVDVVLKQQIAGTLTAWLTADADGNITFGTGRTVVISGDGIIQSAAPRVVLKDSDCTDADDNATIEATATDTGTGTEDVDVVLKQQIAGTLTAWLTADADGNITFGTGRTVRADVMLVNADGPTAVEKFRVSGSYANLDGIFIGGTSYTGYAPYIGNRGGDNWFSGNISGANIAGGAYNSGFGNNNLAQVTTGQGNNAMGHDSLAAVQTGFHNTANGYKGLSQTTTDRNTALGAWCLWNLTTGYYCTAAGYSSGSNAVTNALGLFVGYNAQPAANNTSNEIVIGGDATGNGSNTVTIGNSNITANYFRGSIVVSGADPKYVLKDTDCTDADDNATIEATATDTGTGTEDVDVVLKQQIAGTLTAWLTADADGNITFGTGRNLEIGGDVNLASGKVYKVNGTQVVGAQQTALTAQLTTVTHDAPGTPDYDFTGSVTNSSPYGLTTADEFKTLLYVVANLQTRLGEAETKLKAHGLFA